MSSRRSHLLVVILVLHARSASAQDPVLLGIFGPMPELFYDVVVVGEDVYLGGANNLWQVDVSDPTSPSGVAIGFNWHTGLTVADGCLYRTSYAAPTLAISNVENPGCGGTFDLPGSFGFATHVAGDVAYLLADPGGIRILDVSNMPTIEEHGFFDPPGVTLGGVAALGNRAYVSATNDGIFVLDVSDPALPVHVDTWPGAVGGVNIAGTHLYVGGDTLRIYDVVDPDNPLIIGFLPSPGGVSRIDLAEGLAYGGGLVTDISDPTRPFAVADVTLDSPFSGVGFTDGEGDLVFIAHAILGLHIFRIFPPDPPSPVAVPTQPLLLALFLVLAGAHVGRRHPGR